MKCQHLTHSGHCADPTQPYRPPCTARVCTAKNQARPLHLATLKRLTPAAARTEYIAEVDRAEGSVSGMLLRAEFRDWWESRHITDAAATRQEAPGGAETAAPPPADTQSEKTAQAAGNLEN